MTPRWSAFYWKQLVVWRPQILLFLCSVFIVWLFLVGLQPHKNARQNEPRTLVIVLAETRASELTWDGFQKNVLSALNADLAVCVSNNSSPEDPFMRTAKYKWIYPEPSDWSDAYDEVCGCRGCWRIVLQVRDQLFGGIKDPQYQHPGSAGILIFYRWFLLQNLVSQNIIGDYDYFIVTRSDLYYTSPHPRPTRKTSASTIWFPEGEDYNGYTDRHMVVPRAHVYSSLSLLEPIITNPTGLYNSMKHFGGWNLEQYIKFHFEQSGIVRFVRRFPRVMFAVRGPNTSTRWSYGEYVPEVNMTVKYKTEYDLTKSSVPWEELD